MRNALASRKKACLDLKRDLKFFSFKIGAKICAEEPVRSSLALFLYSSRHVEKGREKRKKARKFEISNDAHTVQIHESYWLMYVGYGEYDGPAASPGYPDAGGYGAGGEKPAPPELHGYCP